MEIKVDNDNFKKEVLDSHLPVLVDFWAEWCMPCKRIAPLVEELAKEYAGKLKVCKVNVNEAPELASKYGIMSIPTLMVFKDGEIVDSLVGVVEKKVIEDMIKPHIEG